MLGFGLEISSELLKELARVEFCVKARLKIIFYLSKDVRSSNGFNCLHWLALSERDDFAPLHLLARALKRMLTKSSSLPATSVELSSFEVTLKSFINQPTSRAGQTPLMLASIHNKQNMCKFLLDNDVCIPGMSIFNFACPLRKI